MEVSEPPAKRRKITPCAGHKPVTRASLARTQQNDSTLPAYVYRALKKKNEIRIFKVEKIGPNEWQYDIQHTTLANAPPFETVSYVWGPDTRQNIIRLRGDRTIRVNDNLAKALSYLSAECKTGYLWIDQININQSSTQERNHQVKMMGDIYKKGGRVIAWLGMGPEPSKEVLALIEVARSSLELRESSSLIKEKVESELLKLCLKDFLTVLRLFESEWFSRAWVFQEIVLSKQATFLYGHLVVPFLALVWISKIFATSRILTGTHYCQIRSSEPIEDSIQPTPNLGMLSTHSYRTLSVMHHSWHAVSSRLPFSDLPFIWKLSRLSPLLQTTDMKDSVYAFLGLQRPVWHGPRCRIQADYNLSYEKTLINAALTIIRSMRSLDILSYCERENGSYLSKRLPSWVPEWKAPILAPLLVRNRSSAYILSRGFDQRKGSDELHVRGVCLDTISTCFAPEYRFRATTWYDENLEEYLALDERRHLVQKFTVCSRERLLDVLLTRHYRPDVDFKDYHGNSQDYSTSALLKEYDDYIATRDENQVVKESKNLCALRYLTYSLNNRQLFLTTGGHLGYVKQPSEGDMVFILKGFRHLIVLRPYGNNRFTVVGTCHLEDQLCDLYHLRTESGFHPDAFWENHKGKEFVLV